VAGSGAGGRVTIEDFERFLRSLDDHKTSPASHMRIAVADSMRRSWYRPLATVGRSILLDRVLVHRKSCEPKPGRQKTSERRFWDQDLFPTRARRLRDCNPLVLLASSLSVGLPQRVEELQQRFRSFLDQVDSEPGFT
jgi:hypothetical protein